MSAFVNSCPARASQSSARRDLLCRNTAHASALNGKIDALRTREARLIAKRDDLEVIALQESLAKRKAEPNVAMIVAGQRRIIDD